MGGWNMYAMAYNNSICFFDILGLLPPGTGLTYIGCNPSYVPSDYPAIYPVYCAALVSYVDHRLAGIPKYDFSEWYQRRFPKTTAYAENHFRSQISQELKRSVCNGGHFDESNIEIIPILAYSNGEDTEVPADAFNESKFGDRAQSGFSGALGLGRYTMRMVDLEYRKCCATECGGNVITWTAKWAVIDTLGVSPSNVGAPPNPSEFVDYRNWLSYWFIRLAFFGGERDANIAEWKIEGVVHCD
jgi:hypothetical protein